jgi:cytochrome c oxidase subunit 3
MKPDYSKELDPAVREKMKKNLVYVSIFSIVMLFAGLTSAYIVSMGDLFWLKYPLPSGFWISTGLIALSSILYIIAIKAAKKNKLSQLRLMMSLTLLSGIGFAVFQVVGYRQLIESGANPVNPIMVTEGTYGDYFEIKYKGEFIEVDENDYRIKGKTLSEQQFNEVKNFMKIFENTASRNGYYIKSLSPNFVLYYKNEPLNLQNGKLIKPNGEVIQYTDMKRLKSLSLNIQKGIVDFFHKGKLGEDFHIYYKGKELSYKNRTLMFGNKLLNGPLQIRIKQTGDNSTSYLYIITFLHFLHIFGALIYLIKMVRFSFSSTFDDRNVLSLRLGAIFWHFLGLLWLYLLLFFLFIH